MKQNLLQKNKSCFKVTFIELGKNEFKNIR